MIRVRVFRDFEADTAWTCPRDLDKLARMARGGELSLACQRVRHLWYRYMRTDGEAYNAYDDYMALRNQIEKRSGLRIIHGSP